MMKAVKLNPEFFDEIVDVILEKEGDWRIVDFCCDACKIDCKLELDSKKSVMNGISMAGAKVFNIIKAVCDKVYNPIEGLTMDEIRKVTKASIKANELIENAWYEVIEGDEYVDSTERYVDCDELPSVVVDYLSNIKGARVCKNALRLDCDSCMDSGYMSESVYNVLKEKGYILEEVELDPDKWYKANRDLVWKSWELEDDADGPNFNFDRLNVKDNLRQVYVPEGSELKLNPDNYELLIVKPKGSDKEEVLYIPEFRRYNYDIRDELGCLKRYGNAFDIIFG